MIIEGVNFAVVVAVMACTLLGIVLGELLWRCLFMKRWPWQVHAFRAWRKRRAGR